MLCVDELNKGLLHVGVLLLEQVRHGHVEAQHSELLYVEAQDSELLHVDTQDSELLHCDIINVELLHVEVVNGGNILDEQKPIHIVTAVLLHKNQDIC